VVVLAAVGASCIPATPPPPPLYQVPVVRGVTASPAPAVPGQPVTVSVDVVDDEAVSHVQISRVLIPSGVTLLGPPPCTSAILPGVEVGHATVELTCDVPTPASNGTWNVEVRILDWPGPDAAVPGTSYPGLETLIPFEVGGGVDDRTPPQIVEWKVEPVPVRADTPITLTMRLHDDVSVVDPPAAYGSRAFGKVGAPWSAFRCGPQTITAVSATESIVTSTCSPVYQGVPGAIEPGRYVADMPVADALGNWETTELSFEVR
jgi:hypothetical protein